MITDFWGWGNPFLHFPAYIWILDMIREIGVACAVIAFTRWVERRDTE